jgi:uncharacterized YigZ family protein
MEDHFDVVRERHQSSFKIQRSEFIAIAIPLTTTTEFDRELTAVQKQYFDATHHCWGYRLFTEGAPVERSSDAGEPNGTAGKPIANAIQSARLFDTAMIVVRYYGGVKLGTGGLARAYRDAAAAALDSAPRLTRYVMTRIGVTVPFEKLNAAYRLIAPPDIRLEHEEFAAENTFTYLVRQSRVEAFVNGLTEARFAHVVGETVVV